MNLKHNIMPKGKKDRLKSSFNFYEEGLYNEGLSEKIFKAWSLAR